jgi:hypothetical protein
MGLPDGAVRDMKDADVEQYTVVRVADEIVVDLLKAACGIGYRQASGLIEVVPIDGVPIPVARPALRWKT